MTTKQHKSKSGNTEKEVVKKDIASNKRLTAVEAEVKSLKRQVKYLMDLKQPQSDRKGNFPIGAVVIPIKEK